MPDTDTSLALEILLQTLKENPDLWETRKKTAKLLFQSEEYLEAADILWNAPEIPATDVDVAFALKVISRVKPNRSIRLIYEVIRRNKDKPHKHMAVARALNDIGMYMEAARFYGAALATDTSLFDLGFERQALWLDDSKRLLEEWRKSDQDSKPPLDVPRQDLSGGMITPDSLPDPQQAAVAAPSPLAAPGMPATPAAPATRPLMVAGGSPPPAAASPVMPQPVATQPLLTPGLAAPKTNPLLTPGAVPTATQPLLTPGLSAPQTNPLLTPGAGPTATQPLLTPGVNSVSASAPLRTANPTALAPAAFATAQLTPPAQAFAGNPLQQNLVQPGMGVRSDTQNLSQPMQAGGQQPPLPHRPASMISSPHVPSQPLPVRPMSQPLAYAPVGTQPLGVAPVSTQPLGFAPQQPVVYAPVSTQPLGLAGQPMMQPMMQPMQPMMQPMQQPMQPMQPMVQPMQPGEAPKFKLQ